MMEDEQKWWRENIKDTVARVPGLSERLAETRAAVAAYKAKPGATIHVFPR